MKPKNVIMWMLCTAIIVLLMSNSVLAQGLREVPASDILKQIENGEDIRFKNVRITGELKGRDIKQEIVESEISILHSVFENDIDFRGVQFFSKGVAFTNTSFLGKIDFGGVTFGDDAFFWNASFSDEAYFRYVTFKGKTYFHCARFGENADFEHASFDDYADFWNASFSDEAYFRDVTFKGKTYFHCARFGENADFEHASFGDYADFRNASFGDYARFRDVTFSDDACFQYATFSDDADFRDASFNDDANFEDVNFMGNSHFINTKFNDVFFFDSQFTEVSFNRTDFKSMRVSWSSLENVLVFNGPIYMKLIKNFRAIEQFNDADDAYYQYRRLSQANKKWSFSKLGDVFIWATCGYGVKPIYTIGLALVIILLFALIYWRSDGIMRLKEGDEEDSRVSFGDAFYFSVVTFTTVGYGDWYPVDRYRKFVMIEGLVGWLTLALFLVTLANVMIRP